MIVLYLCVMINSVFKEKPSLAPKFDNHKTFNRLHPLRFALPILCVVHCPIAANCIGASPDHRRNYRTVETDNHHCYQTKAEPTASAQTGGAAFRPAANALENAGATC